MKNSHWNVDDELASLKDEIKNELSQKNTYQPHDRYQNIQGNENVQVGGNIVIRSRKKVDPRNPNATRCPQCHELTYVRSDWCTECNFNLREYFDSIARQRERTRLNKLIVSFAAIGCVILYFAGHFFKKGELLFPTIIGLGFLGVAAIFAKQLENL